MELFEQYIDQGFVDYLAQFGPFVMVGVLLGVIAAIIGWVAGFVVRLGRVDP